MWTIPTKSKQKVMQVLKAVQIGQQHGTVEKRSDPQPWRHEFDFETQEKEKEY